ncbi:hypothetical protein BC833DRAFT_612495 [Globomyces pollinis-pini]|nr:hypothetical protein BC833DRAFT_612495 [Globomyces pollinis-pini]
MKCHLLIHSLQIGLLIYFIARKQIELPSYLSFDWGFLIPSLGIIVDVIFLLLFKLVGNSTFIHIVVPELTEAQLCEIRLREQSEELGKGWYSLEPELVVTTHQ